MPKMHTLTVKRRVEVGDVLQNVNTKEKIVYRASDLEVLRPEDWEFVGTCYCINND